MRKLDMAWINGNIYTADDKFSTVAAFGVSGTDLVLLAVQRRFLKIVMNTRRS